MGRLTASLTYGSKGVTLVFSRLDSLLILRQVDSTCKIII